MIIKELYHFIKAIFVAKIAQFEEKCLHLSLFDGYKYLLMLFIRYGEAID